MSVVVPMPQGGQAPPRRCGRVAFRRLANFAATIFVLCAAASFPASAVFDVRTISVSGNAAVPTEEILRRGELLSPELNAFQIDAGSLRARLRGDPRIEDVSVSMAFPSRLGLRIRERPPAAALVLGESYVLLSRDAIAITPADDPGALPQLFVGRLDPHAVTLGAAVDVPDARLGARVAGALPPSLKARIAGVRVDQDGDAVLILRDGMSVRLGGARGIEGRLDMVPEVLDAIAVRGMQIESLDLRVPGNIIVHPASRSSAPAQNGAPPSAAGGVRQEKPPPRGIHPAHRPSAP